MKFSEKWLREWVDPAMTTEELGHQLTMAGLELDGVEPVAAAFSGVVVGRVVKIESHPDADKLRVCTVDVAGASDEPLQIVCGAANVCEGMIAPTAMIGAKLPGDFKIKKSKLRGVASMGMLCSASELGLAESSDGLMPLPDDAPVGEDFREYLDLDDLIIEVDLTPNRGDCLSLAGVAREVGVICRQEVNWPAFEVIGSKIDDTFPVKVDEPSDCPRYLGRIIRGVDQTKETPLWMQERLRRGGIRSLGALVDVTNYVLLELGQPMHAFDLNKLTGSINVRKAQKGEKLTLLNENEVEFNESTLLITDDSGPLAIAGVMGGEASAVSADTTDIFLESAFFAPISIAGQARSYGLHTDSSHRFERGVDPENCRNAMERATQLLTDICGGEVAPITEVSSDADLPKPSTIVLRISRVEKVLGITLNGDEVIAIFKQLGFDVSGSGDNLTVTVPTFRFDLTLEVDLIEEVGRIIGYDKLPVSMIASSFSPTLIPEAHISKNVLRNALVERGYQEAITYSFVDPEVEKVLNPEAESYPLANPISAELSVMRTTLWSGMLPALKHNVNRQQDRVRLFETGKRFIKQGDELIQEDVIAGVLYGSIQPEQWGETDREIDFFDLKGDIESLLMLTGDLNRFEFASGHVDSLHPGQSARILLDGEAIGLLGMIHPKVAEQLNVPVHTFMFEIGLKSLQS
ncbi:MAG: phenylalanine--tRNA ligase subunit beta, partial [Chromatiales bacterium]|nr:phenylalanine--tRNA ligase subunit beta [Chromatiales bacterium]